MRAALAIRGAIEAADLRRLARRERDGRVAARLLAIAIAREGMSRKDAARASSSAAAARENHSRASSRRFAASSASA